MRKLILVMLLVLGMTACQQTAPPFVANTSIGGYELTLDGSYTLKSDEFVYGFQMITYINEEGKTLKIIEEPDAGYVVDEARLEEEFTEVEGIHVERVEVLDLENVGKVYGVLADDEQLHQSYFMYKFNVDQHVVTVLLIQDDAFSKEDEGHAKAIITSLKFK